MTTSSVRMITLQSSDARANIPKPPRMNILVILANYGKRNDVYLRQLLDEYRAMSHHLDIVVLSNQPKYLGPDVEVRIERPKGNPWTFPFAHKQILAERCSD